MKVVIFGASGFIGLPMAQAFLRAGHTVYGQTRSQEKAKQLVAEEIIPVVADPDDVRAWQSVVAKADVVIETLAGQDLQTTSTNLLNAVAQVAQTRPVLAPKLTYIYTSGTWVHGEDRQNVVTDTTPIEHPVPLVAWRPTLEQEVIKHPILNGIVIRPSMLYGRSGSLFAIMFSRASEGKLFWPGKPGGRISTIHQDDLADFYVRAAEKSALVKGTIFDASEDVTVSTDELLAKVAKVAGLAGYEYVEPANLFDEALASTGIVRPYLGRTLLGWQPRRHGILDDLELYYNSFKANAGVHRMGKL